ncbi:hypothetical protein K0U07_02025 [bacterium]|nr:hypothetical protein [bacterium]
MESINNQKFNIMGGVALAIANVAVLGRREQSNEMFITLIAANALVAVAIAYKKGCHWFAQKKNAVFAAGVVVITTIQAFKYPEIRNSQGLANANIAISTLIRTALYQMGILRISKQEQKKYLADAFIQQVPYTHEKYGEHTKHQDFLDLTDSVEDLSQLAPITPHQCTRELADQLLEKDLPGPAEEVAILQAEKIGYIFKDCMSAIDGEEPSCIGNTPGYEELLERNVFATSVRAVSSSQNLVTGSLDLE